MPPSRSPQVARSGGHVFEAIPGVKDPNEKVLLIWSYPQNTKKRIFPNFSPPPNPTFPVPFPFSLFPSFPPASNFPSPNGWFQKNIAPSSFNETTSFFFVPEIDSLTGWWFQRFVYFHPPTWKNGPIWLSIFQIGWFNHQLVNSSLTKYGI